MPTYEQVLNEYNLGNVEVTVGFVIGESLMVAQKLSGRMKQKSIEVGEG